MESLPSQRIVSISDALYRLLLRCYPSEFRREYALEMAQTFRTCCQEALQQRGATGVVQLWGAILYDFTTSVFVQHMRTVIAQWRRLFMTSARKTPVFQAGDTRAYLVGRDGLGLLDS
ncbi:MAG TPA: hypothetical protein VNG51_02745 [Ktedonobacteraceae bacterium]|nr:hypothetical protein [Ktedonobacteraceae bacterium]